MRKLLVCVVLGLGCMASGSPAFAGGDSLERALEAVVEQNRLLTPLRADASLRIHDVDGDRKEKAVWITRNDPSGAGVDTYFELVTSGTKLLRLGERSAHVLRGGKLEDLAPGDRFGAGPWAVEDFDRFDPSLCTPIQVADLQPDQITVNCVPLDREKSRYSQIVYKLDRRKGVPLQVLYYEETLNNLVKMERHRGIRLVGARWRPTEITVRDFQLQTKLEVELIWQQDPKFRPELFDPLSLAEQPSMAPSN